LAKAKMILSNPNKIQGPKNRNYGKYILQYLFLERNNRQ
jgi:hypothetical protein